MASLLRSSRLYHALAVMTTGAMYETSGRPHGRAPALVGSRRSKSVFAVAGLGTAVGYYGLERCCFSRVISAGDQSRTSVTSFHASM